MEQAAYTSFLTRLESFGVEPLSSYTLSLWQRYFLENPQVKFVKFVRRNDGALWLGAPGVGHPDLKNNGGDTRSMVIDAGSISFVQETAEETRILIHDNSGTLNIGHDREQRMVTQKTIEVIAQGLLGVSIISQM